MNIRTILMTCAALALISCSSAKEQLGLSRKAPDEFAVVKRAPLTMPPSNSLPRPSPGAPRPQEQATSEQAKQALFGSSEPKTTNAVSSSSGDDNSAFLTKIGAEQADPNIRRKVDVETEKLSKENIPVARKLFGMGGDPNTAPTSVVNAKEEAERLKQNKEQGKPVTAGKTPTVNQ